MSRSHARTCLLAGLALAGVALVTPVPAGRPPLVAAAANLSVVLEEIAGRFAQEQGTPVEISYGSSGTLTRQIRDGAPFELFLAADEEFPRRLHAEGLTRDAGVVYAVGRLAIFAPHGSPLAVDDRLDGLTTLARSGRLTRLAIANPRVAPYGQAAEAVLRARGLWEMVEPRLVYGDSVAQAAQFATTGNAAGGLLPHSLVLAPALKARGRYALLPEADHPPLRQRMVLLKRAGPVAERFYEYLQADTARGIFARHGYAAPASPGGGDSLARLTPEPTGHHWRERGASGRDRATFHTSPHLVHRQ
jgi:molybdate transport system substrate-binding protein